MTIDVTEKNFNSVVLNSSKPVMVDLWAPWCGPCRMISPILEEISDEYSDEIIVAKCNVDENPSITLQYSIRNIPAVLFFKNGDVIDRMIGATNKSGYVKKIQTITQ
ncbi:MAG: Thioredoxin [Bacteroidetes bacterium ADurb.Bin028]|jgi:thioredoxin 1|nr:MAG: Thioredoxin [Bacteroidetes bacterium ADurb.Bin028]